MNCGIVVIVNSGEIDKDEYKDKDKDNGKHKDKDKDIWRTPPKSNPRDL